MSPLQTALSLGLQYPPLAKEALAALERLETEWPQAIRAVAPQIVPLLDPYLLDITDMAADTDDAVAAGKALNHLHERWLVSVPIQPVSAGFEPEKLECVRA